MYVCIYIHTLNIMLLINISVVYLRSYILNEYSFANLMKHKSKILSKVL